MEATLGRQNNLFNKEFYTKNEEISNASSQQAPSQFASFEDLDKASINNNNNNSNNLSVNNNINNYSLNDLQKNLQYSNNSQLFGANNQLNQIQNNGDGNNKQLQQQQLIKQNEHMMQPSFLQSNTIFQNTNFNNNSFMKSQPENIMNMGNQKNFSYDISAIMGSVGLSQNNFQNNSYLLNQNSSYNQNQDNTNNNNQKFQEDLNSNNLWNNFDIGSQFLRNNQLQQKDSIQQKFLQQQIKALRQQPNSSQFGQCESDNIKLEDNLLMNKNYSYDFLNNKQLDFLQFSQNGDNSQILLYLANKQLNSQNGNNHFQNQYQLLGSKNQRDNIESANANTKEKIQLNIQQINKVDQNEHQQYKSQGQNNSQNYTQAQQTFFKKRRRGEEVAKKNTFKSSGINKNQNQPSFFGKRIKNFLQSSFYPLRKKYQSICENKMGENYEQFLKWLDQPEQIMKEIWQFEEIYSLRKKETQQIKNFKKLLKQASIEMYSNYMINQIIRSGEVQHSKTFQNSQIKKQALIQTLSDFLIQVNDVKNLNGIFSDKKQMKKQDNNQQDQIKGNKKVILGKGNGQQIIINSNSNIIQNDLTGNDQDFSQQENQKQYNENKSNDQNNKNYQNNQNLVGNQEILQKQEQIVIQKQQDQNYNSKQDNKN